MIEVMSIDKFPGPAKIGGTVYNVHAPFEMNRDNPEIRGQIVRIDGEEMLVSGIECFRPLFPIRKGEIIGLWVKP